MLQAGRAIAALAVVFHHAARSTADFVGGVPPALAAVLERGYLGVDFFFVLSGFIIYHTNMGKAPTWQWSWRYLESRFVRIYVPYLPVGLAIAIAYTLLPGVSAGAREWDWLSTLTLLPTAREPALVVAWTLRHELVFYLLFWLFALSSRPLLGAGVWLAAIVAWNAIAGEPANPLLTVLGPINAEFFFGMAAARIVASGGPSSLRFTAAAALLMGLFLALGGLAEHRVIFGLSVALFLVPIIRAEQAGALRVPRALVFLGDASYAIYLVHNPLMALLARVPPGHWSIALVYFAAMGTALGVVYHIVYERPAIAFVRGRLARLRLRHTGERGSAT